jgi:hypothetical protein
MAIINTINGKYDDEKKCLTHEEYRKPAANPEKAKEESGNTPINSSAATNLPATKTDVPAEQPKAEGSAEPSKTEIPVPESKADSTKRPSVDAETQPEQIKLADKPSIHISADALAAKPEHELPTDYLMEEFQEVADKLSSLMNCSEDIVISTMFAVVSGAVGSKVSVSDGVYTNRLNINVCHVAPPGSNKTQPVSVLSNPLQDISQELFMQYKEELKDCKARKDFDNMPKPQILYATSPTPEALVKYMAYNPRGIFARRDELSGFIDDLMGRYGSGSGGVPDFLSTFTNESISILRVQEDPLVVQKPYLTVVGGIQPGLLKDTFGNPKLVNSGFNYRWLFCYPKIMFSLERPHDPLPSELTDYWEMMVRRYYNMLPMKLTFNEEALKLLDDYYRTVQKKAMDGGSDYDNEVRSKLLIYIEKWAALATLMHGEKVDFSFGQNKEAIGDRFVDGTPCLPVVSGEAMEYSVRCMDVFEQWHNKVHKVSLEDNNSKDITLAQAICKINSLHPIHDKRKFAESCGMRREFVYKCLNHQLPDREVNDGNCQVLDSSNAPILDTEI